MQQLPQLHFHGPSSSIQRLPNKLLMLILSHTTSQSLLTPDQFLTFCHLHPECENHCVPPLLTEPLAQVLHWMGSLRMTDPWWVSHYNGCELKTQHLDWSCWEQLC